jgi:hypothetical protein
VSTAHSPSLPQLLRGGLGSVDIHRSQTMTLTKESMDANDRTVFSQPVSPLPSYPLQHGYQSRKTTSSPSLASAGVRVGFLRRGLPMAPFGGRAVVIGGNRISWDQLF